MKNEEMRNLKVWFLFLIFMIPTNSFAESITLFHKAHVFFTGSQNRRSIESVVEFPQRERQFERLILTVKLSCPDQGCDWWDRFGSISLLDDVKGEMEIFRFMTPYQTGATWQLDVTDLRPLFTGRKKLKVFIDTWVGPGSSQGEGWLLDASLDLKTGQPRTKVLDVVPLFHPTAVVYGDPLRAPSLNAKLSARIHSNKGRLWTWITGHGQGNTENCAEFCPKNHTLSVGEYSMSRIIWRSNCEDTVTDSPQMGTWRYARAGWCPGAQVEPWIADLPRGFMDHNQALSVSWRPESYTNTNRYGYDGTLHTEPYHQVSALLVLFNE